MTLLQWQSVGNVFKLACWPLGFAFVAAARPRIFLLTKIYCNLALMALTCLGLSAFGLQIAGFAFLVGYVLQFLVLNRLAGRLHVFVGKACH
ncbi:hypothetical protein [Spiribacter vilamensis]|uniref:hypothetical protein n=1 Tax=Spiribacter vilamensis TaxID=531306 RepID=UPI00102B9C86|nr:hypothetical protein [Spiribacter vilamensis]TVO61900.1 hypothetical protein FPL09_07290 [Spiribacter vilamensis]